MVRVFISVERKRESSLLSREAPREYTQFATRAPYRFEDQKDGQTSTGYGHGSCNLARFGDDAVLEGQRLIV